MAVSALLFCCNITSFAQDYSFAYKCKAYEFSEMTAMSKSELDQLLCKNKEILQANKNMVSSLSDISDKYNSLEIREKNSKQSSMYIENQNTCSLENERVVRAMKKVNPKASIPNC